MFPSSPEWWNGRHDRLKICCEQSCKSSSLFSGRTRFPVKGNLFCLTCHMRRVIFLAAGLRIVCGSRQPRPCGRLLYPCCRRCLLWFWQPLCMRQWHEVKSHSAALPYQEYFGFRCPEGNSPVFLEVKASCF